MVENVFQIKPYAKKVMLKNISIGLSIFLLLFILILVVPKVIDADLFATVLDTFSIGLPSNSSILIKYMTYGLPLLILYIIGSYLNLKGTIYEFHNDHLVIYTKDLFILTKTKEIRYENISNINFETKGILNTIMDISSINFELEGTDKKNISLDNINDPEQKVSYINNILRNYNYLRAQEYDNTQRINNIMDNF